MKKKRKAGKEESAGQLGCVPEFVGARKSAKSAIIDFVMASRVVQLAKEASASKEKLNNLVQLLKCCASEDASECMAASKAVGHVLHQYSQVSGARGLSTAGGSLTSSVPSRSSDPTPGPLACAHLYPTLALNSSSSPACLYFNFARSKTNTNIDNPDLLLLTGGQCDFPRSA